LRPQKTNNFIELSSLQFYLLLQIIVIVCIFLYQSLWFFGSKNTMADCFVYGRQNQLKNSGTLYYRYYDNYNWYEDYGARSEVPISQEKIEIKYLSFMPSVSRINSFENNWLGFMIAYGIFLTITSLIFLIDNDTMPKNSFFYFSTKKPWVNMIVK
jgi:hypothetical protein